jgi:ribonuclease III
MSSANHIDITDSINLDENMESYILNEQNKFITSKVVNNIFKKYNLDYTVKDITLFQRSLTHTSYLQLHKINDKNIKRQQTYIKETDIKPIENNKKESTIPLQENSYERLEFLGDSVIRSVLSDYLYCRYKNSDEGFMTRLRTKIENGESLAKLSKLVGLNEYILISKLIETKNGRCQNVSILEDVFEAFVGALYLEADYNICKIFITNVVEKEIDIAELLHHEDNYKDVLLRHYHKKKWDDPKYTALTTTTTKDNKKEFTMCVKDNNGKIIGIGSGTSKKKGEQGAAHNALIKLGVISTNSDSEEETCKYQLSDEESNYSISSGEYEGTDSEDSLLHQSVQIN